MTGHWQGKIEDFSQEFGWIGRHQGCTLRMVLTRGDGQRWLLKQYLWPMPSDARAVVVFQGGTLLERGVHNEEFLDFVAASLRFVGGP